MDNDRRDLIRSDNDSDERPTDEEDTTESQPGSSRSVTPRASPSGKKKKLRSRLAIPGRRLTNRGMQDANEDANNNIINVPVGAGGNHSRPPSQQATVVHPAKKAFSIGGFSGSESQDLMISWHNLNVFATGTPPRRRQSIWSSLLESAKNLRQKQQRPTKQILKNVSGKALPGRLMAIMGASGAGKTTFLNVLTQRNIRNVVVDGRVCVNGQNIGQGMRGISAYVQQQDLFIGTLKVKEHLAFQAILRMGRGSTRTERAERVRSVMQELGLSKCADTLIGVPGRVKGISGGEKKRTSFASEILTNPPILYCDEPTSGLDSYMAEQVVSVLKSMAQKGRTIICTIHQPSSQVFSYFDDLLLMAEGRVAFIGPTKEAARFFERLNFPCPTNYNPADHYIKQLAVVPGKESECQQRIKAICDAFEKNRESEAAKLGGSGSSSSFAVPGISDVPLESYSVQRKAKYRATAWQQFMALMWRGLLASIRQPVLVRVRCVQTIIIAVLLGITYFQTPICCLTVQNINGLLFLLIIQMTLPYVFSTSEVFCSELPIFLREHLSNLYRVDIYFITKAFSELPQYTVFPFMYITIVYWMTGLHADAGHFFLTALIILLVASTATSFGYLVSTLTGNAAVALSVAPVIVIPFMLFGGFFLNKTSVPSYFVLLQYASFYKYAYESLAITQWADVKDIPRCGENHTACLTDGDEVLAMLSFNKDALTLNIFVLFALIVGIRLLAYLALLWRSRRRN